MAMPTRDAMKYLLGYPNITLFEYYSMMFNGVFQCLIILYRL